MAEACGITTRPRLRRPLHHDDFQLPSAPVPSNMGALALRCPSRVGASPRKSFCSRGCAFTAQQREPLAFTLRLFVYDLNLLVDHLAGEPVDSYVHPVTLFA